MLWTELWRTWVSEKVKSRDVCVSGLCLSLSFTLMNTKEEEEEETAKHAMWVRMRKEGPFTDNITFYSIWHYPFWLLHNQTRSSWKKNAREKVCCDYNLHSDDNKIILVNSIKDIIATPTVKLYGMHWSEQGKKKIISTKRHDTFPKHFLTYVHN